MTLSNPAQYISGRTVQEQMNSLIDYVDQRAADVALDAIASDVAQVHQDMLDADADAAAAAASAAAAAGTLANAVKKTGEASQSIAGDIAVSGDLSAGGDLNVTGDTGVQGQLSVLGGCDLRAPVKIPVSPTNNDDAASKKYVDDHHDATKLSITDVNTYAVGLTGNQTVAGEKKFTSVIPGVAVGQRIRGQFDPNKWYEVAKFNQSGRRNYHVKVTMTSGTFNTFLQIEGLTGSNAFLCRRLGNITTSSYPTSSLAIGVDSSSNKCIFVKGYDNRWITTVEIGEEFRAGSVMEGTAGALTPMDDLTAYTSVVYGSDMS